MSCMTRRSTGGLRDPPATAAADVGELTARLVGVLRPAEWSGERRVMWTRVGRSNDRSPGIRFVREARGPARGEMRG